jgi:hypothetical protein
MTVQEVLVKTKSVGCHTQRTPKVFFFYYFGGKRSYEIAGGGDKPVMKQNHNHH